MKICVLGGGRVGGAMARDLAQDGAHAVTVADRDADVLAALRRQAAVDTCETDLADPNRVATLAGQADLVIGAVPGHLGYRTLEAVIRAGRPVVDIAFFPEDPFGLDALARKREVVAVVDCGVFPGLGSALIGRLQRRLDRLDRVLVLVGGLPEIRRWPWEYHAVFSPADVIEEYTRPARCRVDGRIVTKPALSDLERVVLPGVGTLEAFNTDGLRTLLRTIDVPDMREKTLRYPGHVEKIELLRACGFFGTDPVAVGDADIRPRDLAGRLLFPMWEPREGETDLTVMRIEVEGERNGQRLRYTYDLLDRADVEGGVSSMARTTGYTATMTARLIADGLFARKGISPPEELGREFGCVDYLLKGLAQRGVHYHEQVEVVA